MPSRYLYRTVIRNDYLRVSKVIRAMTENELRLVATSQISRWASQEQKSRLQKRKAEERETAKQQLEDLKRMAEEDTKSAQEDLTALRRTLVDSLKRDPTIDWKRLEDHQTL